MSEAVNTNRVLTQADLKKILWRYIWFRQSPFNYETMQSGGWVYAIQPALAKIYDNDADVIAAKNRQHFRFYNTHPWMGNIILGACLAIEETKAPDATETAVDLRTALMGPLAGLGDSIIWVMLPTILGAIASYMAEDGNIFGWVLAEAVQMVLWMLFYKGFFVAYERGIDFVTSKTKELGYLTDAASIVGLAVVGALIASIVNVKFGLSWTVGEITQNLNDLFDAIIPHFANILTMVLVYRGLSRPKMTTGKMVIILIVVGIILGATNILA